MLKSKSIIVRVIPIAMLAVLMSSCVSTEMTRLKQSNYPAIHPSQVQIFMNEEDIEQKYERLALITTKGDANWTKQSKMLDKAKKEAAEIGANAIVVNQLDEPSSGAKVAGAVLGVGTQRRGQILAIRLAN